MEKLKLAIIEDCPNMLFFYKSVLSDRFNIEIFDNLKSVNTDSWEYDLTIADMMLPDGCLIDVLPKLFNSASRLIVVSGLNDLETMRRTHALGSVDYLVKPLTENELLFKIEQIMCSNKEIGDFPNIEDLTRTEEKILKALHSVDSHELLKDDLVQIVWKSNKVEQNTLDVHLSNLRKKIKHIDLNIRTSDNNLIKLCKIT